MSNIKYGKIVDFVHFLIKNSYEYNKNKVFVDATCGNGLDTLFLCKLAQNNGFVYAFDVQENAILRTKELLDNNGLCNFKLINDSHEHILQYIEDEIDVAIFNLGYLPNSDKSIKTSFESTKAAIEGIIEKLSSDGRIYICAYLLHDKGEESSQIIDFISSLCKNKFNVLQIKLLNKENMPPEIYIIERK